MNISKYFLSLLLVLTSATSAVAVKPQTAVNMFVADKSLRHASVGICVMEIDSAKIVASNAPEQADITASTMKAVTAATALETLGKDFTFSTKVYAIGEINNGTLHGNLLIKGGGDPTLGSKYFPEQSSFTDTIASMLANTGIEKIKGSILIDGSAISYPPISQRWMVEDICWDYGAGMFGLNFADNVLNVSFERSGKEPSDITIKPDFPGLEITNLVQLYNPSEPHSSNGVSATIDYNPPALTFYGSTERRKRRYSSTFANPAPHLLLQDSMVRTLNHAGIDIEGSTIKPKHLTDTLELLDYRSPALSEIIKSLMHRSDNMYTEMVLRAMASNSGCPATDEYGIKVAYDFWEKKGLDTSGLFMKDGCGLARNGKASARFLCEMLARSYQDRDSIGVDFATLFPLAGVDGSVKSLLARTSLQGSIALKSGSMGDVQCYAGYYPAQNPKYTVAILVNNFNGTRKELRRNIEYFFLNVFSEIGQ